LYRGLRVSPGISMHVRVSACTTGYARNAGFTLAEKTSVKTRSRDACSHRLESR